MRTSARIWVPPAAVLALGLALLLPRLGASGLWDPWEPRYAQAASEMADRGSWSVPYYRDDERLNKAPLTYWLIGASQSLLGKTELAARLPSALLGALCPALLALAFSLRGRPLEGGLAGAALVTAPQWALLSRFATPDIPLAASLGGLLALALAGPAIERRTKVAACTLLFALAALADWPRGLLLPAWSLLAWSALGGSRRGMLGMTAVAGLYVAGQFLYSVPLLLASFALAAALAAWTLVAELGVRPRVLGLTALAVVLLVVPWFALVAAQASGELKILQYKYAFNLGESLHHHRAPAWTVVRVVGLGALPWIAAALFGLTRAFGRQRDELARVLAGAAVGGALFFTLSEAKMGHFYGVLQPAIAGLAAVGLAALASRRTAVSWLSAALLAWLGWVAWDHPSWILETATVKRNLYGLELEAWVAAAVGLWALVVLVAVLARKPSWTLATVMPAAGLAVALAWWLVPALEPHKSLRPMWSTYTERRAPGEPIGAYGQSKDTGYYYSDNAIVRLKKQAELRGFLDGPAAKFVILTRKDFRKVDAAELGGVWEVLEQRHPSHVLVRFVPESPPKSASPDPNGP